MFKADDADDATQFEPQGSAWGATVRISEPVIEARSSNSHLVGEPEGYRELRRGDSIERFVITGVLGEGGMGHVYAAYDPHLDRKVAIKLLRPEAATGTDARARLLREAQAMAKISHPNVIAVHEVGMFRDQVYMAMEFAAGGTLRDWLAVRHPRREVIDVFVQAGKGLAAAHAAGLVHRDFKPDNVLLTADGGVRVIDFGIVGVAEETARPPEEREEREEREDTVTRAVIEGALSGPTPLSQSLTLTGTVMGTPYYMAPEQFLGQTATARADQFAFCVVLYQALYGCQPFAGTAFDELRTSVLGGQLMPPPRGARVPAWIRRIVVRGLATDPQKRHASMNALLAELARDPGRRARRVATWGAVTVGVAAAAAVMALQPDASSQCAAGARRVDEVWNPGLRERMSAAFAGSGRAYATTSLQRAVGSLDHWQQAWRHGYVDACEATRARGAQSEALLDRRLLCLDRRLAVASSTVGLLVAGGGDAVDRASEVAAALPSVAACADGEALLLAVPPPEDAATRQAVAAVRARLDEAQALRRLARFGPGLERARAALVTATATHYQPVVAEAQLVVGQFLADTSDREAERTLREAMHTAAAANDQALLISAAGWLLQVMAQNSVPYPHALEVAQLAEAIARHARAPVEDTVRLISAIGWTHHVHGQPALARARLEEALALAERQLGPDHPTVLFVLDQLGTVAKDDGRFTDAQRLLERVVASRERGVGKDHPELAEALNNLGHVYRAQGKLVECKARYDRALAIWTAAFGAEHVKVSTAYRSLGGYYSDQGDYAHAIEAYTRALAIKERALGPAHADVGQALSNLAITEESRGNFERARELGERALRILENAYGNDHVLVAFAVSNLGVVARDQRRLEDAVHLFERARQITEKIHGPDHPDIADYLENTATVLQEQGKFDEADAIYTRSLEVVARVYGADHARMAMGLVNLANLRLLRKDDARALEPAQRSLQIFEARLPADHPNLAYAHLAVGQSLLATGHADQAVPHMERALAIREAAQLPIAFLAEARYHLARALYPAAATRRRARALATRALTEATSAGNADLITEIRAWLAHPG